MTAKILNPTPENLRAITEDLKFGEVVALPTETVYGLAGLLSLPEALMRIYETKERPTFDPLIVHVLLPEAHLASLMRLGMLDLRGFSDLAIKRTDLLIRSFWPGPLTLVLPKAPVIPDLVTSGLSTVAVREPAHPVMREVLKRLGEPVCAPSANRFGRISPTTSEAVLSELGDRIESILEGGACSAGLESTIVRVLEDGQLEILRPGAIAREEIERALGVGVSLASTHSALSTPKLAPGNLKSHYAPMTALSLFHRGEFPAQDYDPTDAVLFFDQAGLQDFSRTLIPKTSRVLSYSGDLREASRNLFRMLRELDELGPRKIWAESPPTLEGLGYAILDRLTRASHTP
jgi:L-threonylcarbamoyladenylate synthase